MRLWHNTDNLIHYGTKFSILAMIAKCEKYLKMLVDRMWNGQVKVVVDVGVVYGRERNAHGNLAKTPREIDFVVNKSGERVYVQSAYALPDDEKRDQELKPFSLTGDSFRKIIVRGDVGRRWFDDTGVLNIGLIDFLLDDKVI